VSTATELAKLSQKITAAERKAAAALEADRARLAELRAAQDAEQRAEKDRRDRRARTWARRYLEHEHATDKAAAARAEKDAARAFRAALAAQPWVAALAEWQAAKDRAHAVSVRYNYARRALGQAGTVEASAAEVLPMLAGEVSLAPLAAALRRVILAGDESDPLEDVRALIAATDEAHPLPEAPEPDPNAAPLAWLRRHGARVESVTHEDVHGRTIVMHRSLTAPSEWVMTDPAGTVLDTSHRHARQAPTAEGDDKPRPNTEP